MTPAVFLDRDGVINQGVMDDELGQYESPYHAVDVALEDRAAEGLRLLRELGWPLIVVSNQPAAAKGTVSLDYRLTLFYAGFLFLPAGLIALYLPELRDGEGQRVFRNSVPGEE